MMKKRILAVILAMLVSTALLSGCGSSANTDGQAAAISASGDNTQSGSGEKPKGIKTYTMYVGDPSYTPIDLFQTPVGKKIEEITGVNLQIEYITGSDEKVKSGIMIASGDLPDIIAPHQEILSFIDANTLVPLDDYIEKYGVNIKKTYGNLLNRMKHSKDNKIYSIAFQREGSDQFKCYPFSAFYLPAAVLKDAGWPKVTTLSQYIGIIRDYIKKNPTYDGKPNIGFTCEMDGWRNCIMTNTPYALAGKLKIGYLLDTETYKCEMMDDSQYNYEYLKLMNGLWNEGLLDREMFSQNYDQYLAKIASGRVIGFYDEYWQFETAKTNLEQQGLYDRVPVPMPVLFDNAKVPDAYNGVITCGTYTSSAGVAISKNCKDPEGVFKFIERMCSDEVQKLYEWGIEGVDYEMKDGKMVRNAEQLKNIQDSQYRDKEGTAYTLHAWQLFPQKAPGDLYDDGSGVQDWKHSDQYAQSQYKDYEKEILKAYNITNFNDLFEKPYESEFGYGWDITPTDSDKEIQDINNKVGDVINQYQAKLVMAKKGQFDTVWGNFKKDFRKCNPEKALEWYQENLLNRINAWK